jgi:hypothetical protein
VRVFKTRTLAKFVRQNGIADAGLVAAVDRAMRGLIWVSLVDWFWLSSLRLPVWLRQRENIEDAELKTLREIAATFLKANHEKSHRL